MANARAGCAVVAVNRMFDIPAKARLAGVRMVQGALPDVLTELAPNAVIHSAAISVPPERLCVTRDTHIRRNIEMLAAMLEYARIVSAFRVLFLSLMRMFKADDAPTPDAKYTKATQRTADCPYCGEECWRVADRLRVQGGMFHA